MDRQVSQSQRDNENGLLMAIACNPVSLAFHAFGRLPPGSMSRRFMIDSSLDPTDSHTKYAWRVVAHEEKSTGHFPKLTFTSNKQDSEASQPPCFKHPLRKEQLRSLEWMLRQEASSEPFYEKEVEEAILPNINWRAEGRAKRPIIVRGGIIADEVRGLHSPVVCLDCMAHPKFRCCRTGQVGYGKTAITLGLIATTTCPRPSKKEATPLGLFQTQATLVIVPGHLMGQWPNEIKKFLGSKKSLIAIRNMQDFNKVTLEDLLKCDIVIANFTVLSNEKYFTRLARLSGLDPSTVPNDKVGGRHFNAIYTRVFNSIGYSRQ